MNYLKLSNKILCEGCKEEIVKLADKCGNEIIARFLYNCKEDAEDAHFYIRWVPFDDFRNIEYLAKGNFGEVYEAILVG